MFITQIDITELNLGQFIRNRNGTAYPIYNGYDSGLVLMYNFNNIAALGESGTFIKDMSQYGNNGTGNGAIWTGNGKRDGAYSFNGASSI
jgi:hypothetical protein